MSLCSHVLKVTLSTIVYNPNPCHIIDIGYQILFVIIFVKKKCTSKFLDAVYKINVREYRRGNHKWTILGNWYTRQRTKTQHNMCCYTITLCIVLCYRQCFLTTTWYEKFCLSRRSDRLEYNVYILVLFSHKMTLLSNVIWNIINISTNILIEFGNTN
jgi:hypothetical protein